MHVYACATKCYGTMNSREDGRNSRRFSIPSPEEMEKDSGTAEHCLFEKAASRITQVQENGDVVSVRREDIFVCKRSLNFVPAHVNRPHVFFRNGT